MEIPEIGEWRLEIEKNHHLDPIGFQLPDSKQIVGKFEWIQNEEHKMEILKKDERLWSGIENGKYLLKA